MIENRDFWTGIVVGVGLASVAGYLYFKKEPEIENHEDDFDISEIKSSEKKVPNLYAMKRDDPSYTDVTIDFLNENDDVVKTFTVLARDFYDENKELLFGIDSTGVWYTKFVPLDNGDYYIEKDDGFDRYALDSQGHIYPKPKSEIEQNTMAHYDVFDLDFYKDDEVFVSEDEALIDPKRILGEKIFEYLRNKRSTDEIIVANENNQTQYRIYIKDGSWAYDMYGVSEAYEYMEEFERMSRKKNFDDD